jgi:DNA polymerase III delta prime subunit
MQSPPPHGDRHGVTYERDQDYVRLNRQATDVWRAMIDGRWHTLHELHRITDHPEASISARLRDFRKPEFGGHEVKSKRLENGSGLFRYRLIPNTQEQMVKTHKERVRIDDAPDNVVPLRQKKSKESLLTRYRPTSFEKVLGQEDVIAGLKSAIKQTNAFILSGMSGVGKTTVARLAAKLLLKCHKDNVHEIDAARFSGVEAMSEIIDKLDHLPLLSSGPIVFIIDECQRLSREAWTMLLKTLEESPPDVYWFFCTTELARVPVNIRDQRCTVFHLQAVSTNDIYDYIWAIADLEELGTPDEVLALCAQQALGAPRRALSFLTACGHCEIRDEAARVLNIATAKDQSPDGLGFHLARLLVTPKWREVRLQLKKIRETKTHPEGVRLVVRAYFSKVLDDEDDERAVCYALKVLDCFSDPMTDHTELQQACGRVVFGGTNDQ